MNGKKVISNCISIVCLTDFMLLVINISFYLCVYVYHMYIINEYQINEISVRVCGISNI